MVRRRASDAGIETPIGCHTLRATGITDYLTNGERQRDVLQVMDPRPADLNGFFHA
jgi:integrase